MSQLVGSIVERKTGTSTSPLAPKINGSGQTGFPAAQHRSKSAFSRSRLDEKKSINQERLRQVPPIHTTQSFRPAPSISGETSNDWRGQVEEENLRRVESMTEEEREQERKDILEKFGHGVGDVLRKAREAREAREAKQRQQHTSMTEGTAAILPKTEKREKLVRKSSLASRPASPSSASSTRPSSRLDRHIRFAEVTPKDVYVYESAPPSPRKKLLALMAPTEDDGPVVKLGDWGGKVKIPATGVTQPSSPPDVEMKIENTDDDAHAEEGTPEYIRRRFFPTATPHDPSLAWIEGPDASPEAGPSDPSLRFDLTGTPIPPSVSSTLPTHLGLHHHADGTHAGYTLDDIFLLSRSTVPAQRASMLDVLGRIARKLAKGLKVNAEGIRELKGQETELRKRILAAGVEAMAERGSLGARAVEVMWVCIVGWEEELMPIEGIELKDASSDGVLSTLPLDYVLSQISSAFAAAALPQESLTQLLAIVHRLAQNSNEFASIIVETQGLIANLVQTFLLTPIPPTDSSPEPQPFALQVLITLASASRSNAAILTGPADALLRFVVTFRPASPYSLLLAQSLLTSTFKFYTTLASYGLYSQVATTAYEYLHTVGQHIFSTECQSLQLKEAWLNLLHAWMVCARDPHRTTPSHDILWSQVVGWGWNDDILQLRSILSVDQADVWAALWRSEAAWLEGASVNSIRGGEAEKLAVLEVVRGGFETGVEHQVIEKTLRALMDLLQGSLDGKSLVTNLEPIAKHSSTLASAIRLWLSSLPSASQDKPDSPPFSLPFFQISNLCAKLVTHPLWTLISTEEAPCSIYIYARQLSLLLSSYLDMSRLLPGTSEDLWTAQALTVLRRLLPGDEAFGSRTIENVASIVNAAFMGSRNWHVPPVIWEKKGLEPIIPFLTYPLLSGDVSIGPSWMTPQSISIATTQRMSPASSVQSDTRTGSALPLNRDWFFGPLDYLLRSGQTEIFKSLPLSWDFSETEVVRATLLFARVSREVLRLHGLHDFLLSREEAVFGCMKVFMLEHGQQQDTPSEEVFRDSVVGEFMNELIAPYTISASSPSGPESGELLDVVATRFLGTSTPFYQFYTDFVALYDAISFSHPLFASLLLPPLSMRYPADYRKYVWADYGHIIRTIKTPIEAVIAANVEEFLWPVESNPEVISGYLRGLAKAQMEGFLRLLAIHHVACNIWPDLRPEGAEEGKSIKLLQALVGQGDFDEIREVVNYHQPSKTSTLLPPACFEREGDWKVGRRQFVDRCGSEVKERLEKLF